MPDRETTIKELEKMLNGKWIWEHADFYALVCKGALELLKEQETRFIEDDYWVPMCQSCGFKPFHGFIPSIEGARNWGYKYCPGCGRAVKWDA